jgi:RNA-dependent RNA polymerase
MRFDPSNVFIISDICKRHFPYVQYQLISTILKGANHGEGKVPAEKIFTDGCGFMNRAALVAIAQNMGYAEVPTAVQGRVFGAKGLWVLHPHDHIDGQKPKIWIRDSQLKIRHVFPDCEIFDELHPAHFIFDLVAPSKATVGTRLNRLSIVNLAHNGVSRNVFANLMKACLEEQITPLTRWDISHAMPQLSFHLNKSTGAFNVRLQQFAGGKQRALGHSRRRDNNEDTNTSSGHNLTSTDPMQTRRLPSGRPLSIPEEVLDLVKAGFRPDTEPHLFNELRTAINWIMAESIKKCHTPIPNSADAFIIPGKLVLLPYILYVWL